MRYTGFSTVMPHAPLHRVQELTSALEALGCQVQLDVSRSLLEFTLPGTLESWLQTSGMTLLHETYSDVTGGRCWIHEESELPLEQQAPSAATKMRAPYA